MNPASLKESRFLVEGVRKKVSVLKKVVAVVCPPSIYFNLVKGTSVSKKLFYGLQNVAKDEKGSFTGEISIEMAKDMGATYIIIGHSERRALGETDDDISKKVALCLKYQIKPILCVGESKIDEHAGHLAFIKNQLTRGLCSVSTADISKVLIAYEPLSAIGAKNPITTHEIHQRNIFIKKVLADMYGKAKAFEVSILYGGSVNSSNAKELVEGGEVDGLLVGRDSLVAENFVNILKSLDKIS